MQKIANAALSIAGAFFELGKKILSAVGNVVKSVIEAIKGLFSAFTGGGGGGYRNISGSLFEAMFKFEVLKQVIRKVIQEFKDLVNTAVTAAQTLQTLTIRLDNLIARQIRAAGITQDYAKSISMASDYTQELLGWIQELAVATPFGEETISKTVSLAMAMGWGIESTKELNQRHS